MKICTPTINFKIYYWWKQHIRKDRVPLLSHIMNILYLSHYYYYHNNAHTHKFNVAFLLSLSFSLLYIYSNIYTVALSLSLPYFPPSFYFVPLIFLFIAPSFFLSFSPSSFPYLSLPPLFFFLSLSLFLFIKCSHWLG